MKKQVTLLLILASIFISVPVQARIDIVPQKIIIESRERNGELTILNLFGIKGTFRVELISFRQDENGVYQELSTPLDSNFNPKEIVRFSPRQFTLDAYGRQKIRISLRKPANLPEGEYRFHIKAMRLAQEDEKKQENPNSISVLTNVGVTIPVVIRHGNTSSKANLSDLTLVDSLRTKTNKSELHLNIERTGNASTMGILEVLIQSTNGEERRIGRITNMNIFTDITNRKVKIPLYEKPEGQGRLIVRYYDDKNKRKIFDEASLAL